MLLRTCETGKSTKMKAVIVAYKIKRKNTLRIDNAPILSIYSGCCKISVTNS